ncbi:MAG: transposase [Alphaproteobacteria bacterium]|nr:transposase [Alphaproteobacteria bacterium]
MASRFAGPDSSRCGGSKDTPVVARGSPRRRQSGRAPAGASLKAEWACREWRVIGRFQRSTGVCPDCDWVGPRLRPGIGTWVCGGCGVIHDRDHAASRVILRDATVVRAAGVAPVNANLSPL